MPISDRRGGELLRGLFEVLIPHDDGLRARDALAALESVVPPSEYESETYPRSGVRRFDRIVRNRTVCSRKAGWLIKGGGRWRITDAGRLAYEKLEDPEEFMKEGLRLQAERKRAALEAPTLEEEPPEARRRWGELLRALFELLVEHPEGLRGREALNQLVERVELRESEQGEYQPGVSRFRKRMQFATITPVKAGWLRKDGGVWTVTEAGREALQEYEDPYDFIQNSVKGYVEWAKQQGERAAEPAKGRVRTPRYLPESFPAELPDPRKRMGMGFQANPWYLSTLLELLDRGKVVLPQFQRSFAWQAGEVALLLTSLVQGYPAGSLLLLKSNPDNPLAWRLVEGVDLASEVSPDYLVLDGQQRLTSLSRALYGRGDHLFFFNLPRLASDDVENGIFPVRRPEAEKQGLTKREAQWERHWFPVWKLMGPEEDPFWLSDYVEFHVERGEDRDDMRKRVRYLEDSFLGPLKGYSFPVVELPSDTDLEAVCQIFEMLNKTGLRLTVFDLLTAKLWPRGVHLRDLWDSAKEEYPLLGKEGFRVDPTSLLQAIALSRAESCRKSDLLMLAREGFEEDWLRACAGASRALSVLRSDCGVLAREWLPYGALFPSLFAIAALINDLSGPVVGIAWEKVKRWFWCAAFSQRYEGPVNTLNAADFKQVSAWIEDDESVPDVITGFSLDSMDLRAIENRRNAAYRAVICLTVLAGARDFFTGLRLTPDALGDAKRAIEDHHLFPTGFLVKKGIRKTAENSILNKALIDAQTNRILSDRPPSAYLGDMHERVGEQTVREILESHLLPTSGRGALAGDDLEAFLGAREERILAAISGVTGVDAAKADSDAYLHPARPFTNELALRKVLRSLRGRVFWYDQHLPAKALELLSDEIDPGSVEYLSLLSGPANVTDSAKRQFERFRLEMESLGLATEWRVLPQERARDLHARVMFDEDQAWELPPLNSILKGTVDSIRRSAIDRQPFLEGWTEADAEEFR